MIAQITRMIELAFGCKIYRKSLPRGTDIGHDIDRYFGVGNIKVVFDIGANIGQSSLSYVDDFPKAQIHSFEPVSATFSQFTTNLRAFESRVFGYRLAMGASRGKAVINLLDDSRESSIKHYKTGSSEEIQVETVDEFSQDHCIRHIDFMKIDTEGFEEEVLKGADRMLTEQRIGILYIEAAPRTTDRHFLSFAKLDDVLSQYPYELFGIYEQQSHWNGEKGILYFNPVYVCRKLLGKNIAPNNYPFHDVSH
jgi:FkbM family methyltransferase